jgi:plasmid stabilization system protein ParE
MLLVIKPQAQTDVREIWEWIAKDNESAADRVEAAIYSQIEKLIRMPAIGHRRADVPIPGYLL